MTVEVQLILRFEDFPPEDLDERLEDEFVCIVMEHLEEET